MTEWRLPAPTFLVTVARIRELSGRGKPVMLLGKVHPHGTRAFFPAMILLKTPLVVLLGLIVGVAILAFQFRTTPNRRYLRGRAAWRRSWPLAIAVLLLVLTSLSRNTFAWRYLIPCIPFIAAVAGIGLGRALARHQLQVLIPAFLLLAAWPVTRFHHGLAFFNSLASFAPAHQLAVDSNLDWGQDLGALRAHPDVLALPNLTGALFSPNPSFEGITILPLDGPAQPGTRPYLLSATEYWGMGETPPEWVQPLHNKPADTIIAGKFLLWR
jgi:hypothetical protein